MRRGGAGRGGGWGGAGAGAGGGAESGIGGKSKLRQLGRWLSPQGLSQRSADFDGSVAGTSGRFMASRSAQ